MDLWIKIAPNIILDGSLVKVDNVLIKKEEYDSPKTTWWKIITCKSGFHNEDWLILGKYKTKERALEVIDEIQKLLTPKIEILANKIINNEHNDFYNLTNCYAIMDCNSNIDIRELSTVVYEMPQE